MFADTYCMLSDNARQTTKRWGAYRCQFRSQFLVLWLECLAVTTPRRVEHNEQLLFFPQRFGKRCVVKVEHGLRFAVFLPRHFARWVLCKVKVMARGEEEGDVSKN